MRLQEQTRAQYKKQIGKILASVNRQESQDVKQMYEFLQQARASIADQITQVDGFDQIHLSRILLEVERVIAELQGKYTQYFLPRLASAFNAGERVAAAPFVTSILPAPLITSPQLEIAQRYSASLIKNITRDALGQVDSILRRAMLGTQTPFQIMRSIGAVLRDRTEYQLERITRTEVNRVLNLGTTQRADEISKEITVRKYWLHTNDSRTRDSHRAVGRKTNPDYGGKPIKAKEKFTVGGVKADGPQDASLPPEESINCRCRLIIVPE